MLSYSTKDTRSTEMRNEIMIGNNETLYSDDKDYGKDSYIPISDSDTKQTYRYDDLEDETELRKNLEILSLSSDIENPENFYYKVKIVKTMLDEAITILSEAEKLRDQNDIIEREDLVAQFSHIIFQLYSYRSVGSNFRKIVFTLIRVIKINCCEILNLYQIRVLLHLTQELYSRIDDFDDSQYVKFVLKLENAKLYTTG